MEKAQALETACSMEMELSAYSMLPGYLQNNLNPNPKSYYFFVFLIPL
jgi:hypothetical protein